MEIVFREQIKKPKIQTNKRVVEHELKATLEVHNVTVP